MALKVSKDSRFTMVSSVVKDNVGKTPVSTQKLVKEMQTVFPWITQKEVYEILENMRTLKSKDILGKPHCYF